MVTQGKLAMLWQKQDWWDLLKRLLKNGVQSTALERTVWIVLNLQRSSVLIKIIIAVAFGAIKTRLTQAPAGEFVVRPDGTKHAVGFHGGYDEEDKWLVDPLFQELRI